MIVYSSSNPNVKVNYVTEETKKIEKYPTEFDFIKYFFPLFPINAYQYFKGQL